MHHTSCSSCWALKDASTHANMRHKHSGTYKHLFVFGLSYMEIQMQRTHALMHARTVAFTQNRVRTCAHLSALHRTKHRKRWAFSFSCVHAQIGTQNRQAYTHTCWLIQHGKDGSQCCTITRARAHAQMHLQKLESARACAHKHIHIHIQIHRQRRTQKIFPTPGAPCFEYCEIRCACRHGQIRSQSCSTNLLFVSCCQIQQFFC